MKKTIEKLRQRPKKERQRVAFVGALSVTIVIALVWFSVFITNLNSSPQTAQVEGPISSLIKAFSK